MSELENLPKMQGITAAPQFQNQPMLQGLVPCRTPQEPEPAEAWECPNCGAKAQTGKFCWQCGAAKPQPAPEPEPETWDCPNCGEKAITAKFCSRCGQPKSKPGDPAPEPPLLKISRVRCGNCDVYTTGGSRLTENMQELYLKDDLAILLIKTAEPDIFTMPADDPLVTEVFRKLTDLAAANPGFEKLELPRRNEVKAEKDRIFLPWTEMKEIMEEFAKAVRERELAKNFVLPNAAGLTPMQIPPVTPMMQFMGTGMPAGQPEVPEKPEAWNCPNCGAKGITSNFCYQCGTVRPSDPQPEKPENLPEIEEVHCRNGGRTDYRLSVLQDGDAVLESKARSGMQEEVFPIEKDDPDLDEALRRIRQQMREVPDTPPAEEPDCNEVLLTDGTKRYPDVNALEEILKKLLKASIRNNLRTEPQLQGAVMYQPPKGPLPFADMMGMVAGTGMLEQWQKMQAEQMQKAQEGMQKQADGEGAWKCSCGETGITGKFCPNCGYPRPKS